MHRGQPDEAVQNRHELRHVRHFHSCSKHGANDGAHGERAREQAVASDLLADERGHDGDGHADLVVGAWQQRSAAPAAGKVYLYSGKDGTLIRAWTSKIMGETFGFDATGLGDVDGDGTIDLLLTSAWSTIRGAKSGRVWVVSGR